MPDRRFAAPVQNPGPTDENDRPTQRHRDPPVPGDAPRDGRGPGRGRRLRRGPDGDRARGALGGALRKGSRPLLPLRHDVEPGRAPRADTAGRRGPSPRALAHPDQRAGGRGRAWRAPDALLRVQGRPLRARGDGGLRPHRRGLAPRADPPRGAREHAQLRGRSRPRPAPRARRARLLRPALSRAPSRRRPRLQRRRRDRPFRERARRAVRLDQLLRLEGARRARGVGPRGLLASDRARATRAEAPRGSDAAGRRRRRATAAAAASPSASQERPASRSTSRAWRRTCSSRKRAAPA